MVLKQIRKRAGLSQTQLAMKIGVSTGYISHLETGKRENPSLDVILKLASCLGVTVEQLIAVKKVG